VGFAAARRVAWLFVLENDIMKKAQMWTTAAAVAAILGLVYVAGPGAAQPGADDITKIAAAIKSGDKEGAKKLAAAYAKKAETVEEAMDLFKRKDKDGIGFGAGPKETDGIEAKIRDVARDAPKDYAKNAALYEKMAYNAAAIGMIAEELAPKGDKGMKTRKAWLNAVTDMQAGAASLAKAKSAADVKTAATKMNNACTACHSVFRTN
jgi:hypothetical protein